MRSVFGCRLTGCESLTRSRDVLQEYNGDDYQGGRIVSKACALRDAVRCVPAVHSCDGNVLLLDSGSKQSSVDRRESVCDAPETGMNEAQVAC